MTKEEYLQKLLRDWNKPKREQTAMASKYPQGYFTEKKCKHCGILFSPNAPSELYCSDGCKNYGVADAYYRRTYHITLEEYLDLAEKQNFVCAICGEENFAMGVNHTGCLVVDHSHETGKVRGLLCHNCNRALGLLKDDSSLVSKAFHYLQSVTTIPKGSTLK
ncbi:endonuclease VII domain-containing protein [Megasphaera massiliensis]|jgi:hypothetical protein|uniref:endonuclease VII domain-containing protein n=1 Tax=Megasphaera massiliensis TaxID=1232428 RepID=UPI0020649CA8|nr:endonuclease VII domain-containing protein [uncultured Megasphaera sp.]DAH87829.1 MAG TPA: Recombination endonuclease VII [Bacteriophage sp.]